MTSHRTHSARALSRTAERDDAGASILATLASVLITGTAGNDSLTGTSGNDVIAALTGNDTLDGGAGADTLKGGRGDDTYVVDNAGDVIMEAGPGVDTILASISFAIGTGVENLTLTGSANLTATGNARGNTLTGNSGNNVLDGKAGADHMDGGNGSDIYMVDAGEHGGAEFGDTGTTGTDEVRFAAVSASLLKIYAGDTGIERVVAGTGTGANADTTGAAALDIDAASAPNALTLVGNNGANVLAGTAFADSISGNSGADTLKGNNGNDTIDGGAGNDVLMGGAGNDSLTGGAGNDMFVLANSGAANVDTITDFGSGDKVQLSKAAFAALGNIGALGSTAFYSAAGATAGHDADDRIIYNSTTGAVYYDADGNGSGGAVQIAIIGGHPAMSAGDFAIIA